MRAVVCDRLGDPSVLTGPGYSGTRSRTARRHRQGRRRGRLTSRTSCRSPAAISTSRELPFVPGMEGAGIVHAVGSDVTAWRPGDRVIFGVRPGAFAEYVKVSKPDGLMRLPDGWSKIEGAGLPRRRAHRLPLAGPSRGGEGGRCGAGARRVGRRRPGGRPARQASRRAGDRNGRRRCAARGREAPWRCR